MSAIILFTAAFAVVTSAATAQEAPMPVVRRPVAGIVADWDELPVVLARTLPSVSVKPLVPGSSFSRHWAVALGAQSYQVEVYVYASPDEVAGQLRPTNFGGVESKRPLGDRMIEVGLDGGGLPLALLWERRNVFVHLQEPRGEHEPVGSIKERGKRLRSFGEVIEGFLESHQVKDLAPHVPLLELEAAPPARVEAGRELTIAIRKGQIAPADEELQASGAARAQLAGAKLVVLPQHVGPLHLHLALQNRRTLLTSAPINFDTMVVTSLDQPERKVRDEALPNRALEPGPPLRIVRHAKGETLSTVHVLAVGARLLVLEYRTLAVSSAPPNLVTHLAQAVLVDSKGAERLNPAEIHLEVGFDLTLQGAVTVAGEDWLVDASAPPTPVLDKLRGSGILVE